MPFTYHIDVHHQMLFVVDTGVVTQGERLEIMRTWLNDPAHRPGLNTFADFSAATSTPTLPELEEIVAVMRQHAAAIGRKKLAMLAPQPDTFGVARQFRSLVGSDLVQVEVFRERDAAMNWLELARPAL